MEIVDTPRALIDAYRRLEDPEAPNLMIQELIPGADDQVYIFNGYFNAQSDCLVGFTGYKVRQFPVHVGCASLGECRWVETVAATTVNFMKAIGYRGILDIGYRLDPRDGRNLAVRSRKMLEHLPPDAADRLSATCPGV